MVRIQRDRWYSRENQKSLRNQAPSNSSGNRRLVSLVFLLAIVMVLMQRASDPNSVRQAFNALGLELDREVAAATHSSADRTKPTALDEPITTSTAAAPWQAVCKDLTRRLLETASAEHVNALAQFWFDNEQQRHVETQDLQWLTDLSASSLVKKLKAELDANNSASTDWAELLDRFESQWQILVDACRERASLPRAPVSEIEALDPTNTAQQNAYRQNLSLEFQTALTHQLDERLLIHLRDGGPWITTELIGFGRLLQRGHEFQFGTQDPPLIATQQLNGEHAKFRGQWVRYRGTVRRIDNADRTVPLLPTSTPYFVLWIRGADQSNQPVAVYCTHELVRQLQQTLKAGSYPDIEVIGLVGKKLAYAAEAGVQLAPTLFAGSMIQFVTERPLSPTISDPQVLRSQLKFVTTLAIVLGLVAIWSIWRQVRGRRKSTRSGLPLLLAAWLLVAESPMQRAHGQVPPWAESVSPAKLKTQLIQQRLQPLLQPQPLEQLGSLLDGSTTDLPELVLRTMHTLNQVQWPDLSESTELPAFPEIELSQGYVLRQQTLQGRVRSVQPLTLDAKQREWFSVQPTAAIYRLQVESTDNTAASTSPAMINVFCLNIPKMWRSAAQLNQPLQLQAYSLIHSAGENPARLVCTFAPRPAWKIDQLESTELDQLRPPLAAGWRAMGSLGWDLAWFDLLASQNQKRLTQLETLPLLKMLEIAHEMIDPASLLAASPLEPLEAMKHPLAHLGENIDWQVRLITGSVVDLVHSNHSTRYYQLDGFVYLPNQTVNYVHPESGQTLTFRNEFPCTILTTVANPFVPRERVAAGELNWEIGKTARIQGLFLRLWSYESQRLTTPTATARQVAPLIVAGKLSATTLQQPISSRSLWLTLTLGVAALAITAYFLRSAYQLTVRQPRYRKNG